MLIITAISSYYLKQEQQLSLSLAEREASEYALTHKLTEEEFRSQVLANTFQEEQEEVAEFFCATAIRKIEYASHDRELARQRYREAEVLLSEAARISPDNPQIMGLQNRYPLYQLNLSQVKRRYGQFSFNAHLYAQAFPNYSFTDQHRPSIEELRTFIKAVPDISQLEHRTNRVITSVLHYDWTFRKEVSEEYGLLILEALQLLNPEAQFHFDYDYSNRALSIQANQELRFTKNHGYFNILSLLDLNTLKLSGIEKLYLHRLHSLKVTHLDLSGINTLVSYEGERENGESTLPIHGLKTIIVKKRHIPALKKTLKDLSQYEVTISSTQVKKQ